MPAYICPECKTELKRSKPVEPGKRLRCPECSAVFAPGRAPAAKSPTPPRGDDEDGPVNYGLVAEKEDTEEDRAEREKAYGPLKQRFEKGSRGPGAGDGCQAFQFPAHGRRAHHYHGHHQRRRIHLANGLQGRRNTDKEKGTLRRRKEQDALQGNVPEEYRNGFLQLGGSVLYCLWGAVICAGARGCTRSKPIGWPSPPRRCQSWVQSYLWPFG